MIPSLEDTIVAVAAANAPSGRAIIRVTGADTFRLIDTLLRGSNPQPSNHVEEIWQAVTLPFHGRKLPAYLWRKRGPGTYTGQDLAELHYVGSQPITDYLFHQLLQLGARQALPGEFTQRGFLSGKRDLTQSEAVLGVIEADSDAELQNALKQLAGGVKHPLSRLREDLLNLLADLEAGLDFVDEDIEFVDKSQTLLRLSTGLAQIKNLQRQLIDRPVQDKVFRVALVGEPNAGKSSLFNALSGRENAIVSPEAGTTRDFVSRRVELGERVVELIDTAGWQLAKNEIERQAQAMSQETETIADLVLHCISSESLLSFTPDEDSLTSKRWYVCTKWDLAQTDDSLPFPPESFRTSVRTKEGIEPLKRQILIKASEHHYPALASSLVRCRHQLELSVNKLRESHQAALFDMGTEIVAAELRQALELLGEVTGELHTEELLGRIFSRFCVGK